MSETQKQQPISSAARRNFSLVCRALVRAGQPEAAQVIYDAVTQVYNTDDKGKPAVSADGQRVDWASGNHALDFRTMAGLD